MYRFYLYSKNVQAIKKHNSDPDRTHEAAPNQFTDQTWEEIQASYLTLQPPSDKPSPDIKRHLKEQPDENLADLQKDEPAQSDNIETQAAAVCVPAANPFTWSNITTTNPYPAPVKNQGNCGSCYAFAATQAMTTALSIQKKVNFTVSPQQVVDCDQYDSGCNGGWPTQVFSFAQSAHLMNLGTYPYKAVQGSCKSSSTGYKVSTFGTTTVGSCAAMLVQIAKSPMAVAIYASMSFMSYSTGVFKDSTCPAGSVNHAVYLVGVDSCNNWIIQNSWDVTWGIKGFAKMAANNTCGICNNGGMYVTMA